MENSWNPDCVGCTACAQACPSGAIKMRLNEEGFFEACVDEVACTDCGACRRVCPVNKKSPVARICSYYGWHKDPTARYTSSSGGAFRGIADSLIGENGIVFGAVYSEDHKSVVFADSDSVPLEQLQKSKYITSNPQDVFLRIESKLQEGRRVAFCGTPCQAAGLSRYLKRPYENLILIDFVCGGMPSLTFWQEHAEMLEKKYGSKITGVDFRSKRVAWGKLLFEVSFASGRVYRARSYLDSFYNAFLSDHMSVREQCMSCGFANNHYSDITIADFWGYRAAGIWEEQKKNGLSLIICNSDKGRALIEGCSNLTVFPLENKYSDYAIGPLVPYKKDCDNRTMFFELSQKVGFEKAASTLCPATFLAHLKKYLKVRLGL